MSHEKFTYNESSSMKLHTDVSLSDFLWYKLGGKTRFLLDVFSKEDVVEAFEFLKENSISNYFVMGLGANLIFAHEYFDGAVIRFLPQPHQGMRKVDDETVEAWAGELLDNVICFGFDHHLTGLEWAGGLPGTVGAAIRGNVGAFGGEIKDVLHSVEVLEITDTTHSIVTKSKNELAFSYRNSLIKQQRNLIVLSARFDLSESGHSGVEKAKDAYYAHIAYRKDRHPHEYPNTGSVFKNITDKEYIKKIIEVFPDIQELIENKWYGKVSMGYLNKRLGFAGIQIGKAKVSEQHANFIDNIGDAKAADVIAIIETIQKKFQETFGFTPEPEVEIVK